MSAPDDRIPDATRTTGSQLASANTLVRGSTRNRASPGSGVIRSAWPGRRQVWYLVVLVTVLDTALVGPLVGRGSLHLLDFGDYPQSPHPPFDPSAFGFPPGITNRAPIDAALYWMFQSVGWAPLHLVPFAAVAPLACIGFARLFPGRTTAIAAATLLFTVNPFIYERMASGQVYVVMGYSLLPALLALVVRPLSSLVATAALGGLIFTLAVAVSVHYLFIGGLLLMVVVSGHLVLGQVRAVRAGAGIAGSAALLNMYWLIPAARDSRTMQSHVTHLDLSAFQTMGDPVWGLAVNVAGLYGFWRPGAPLVKNHISGWPFLLLAILVVVGFGLHELYARGGAGGRALALSCAVLCIAGGLLAVGAQGPTGGIYVWLFNHLPGFKVMREAGKFSSLVALGYATCFGTGTEAAARAVTRNLSKVLCLCCVVAISLVYGYTELWGLDGYARPSVYPASWAAADRSMSPGAMAIALPWRAYLPVTWLGNRVVANPTQGYFARPVVSADDLEAGPITTETSDPRSLFLEYCLSEGNRLTEFGRLLAPLGIRYVILAKGQGAESYDWLGRQHDMRRVFDSDAIAVYKNEEAVPSAYEPRRRLVLQDWGQVVALAQHTSLLGYLIQVRDARPGPLNVPTSTAIEPHRTATIIKTAGGTPVSESVALPGTTRTVVLTNPAYAGWQLTGFGTTSQFGVAVAFTSAKGPSHQARLVAAYGPWRLIKECDIGGACLAVGDLALLAIVVIRYRRRARNDSDLVQV
jgi:hypothetical protein